VGEPEEASLTELERYQVPRLMGTSHAVFVSADGADLGRRLASLRFFTAGRASTQPRPRGRLL